MKALLETIMKTTEIIDEAEVTELMRACHLTREEAIALIKQSYRLMTEYQAYLEGPFDPRD